MHTLPALPPERPWLLRHWFVPAALLLALGDLSSVWAQGWTDAPWLEAVLLFDFVVVIPLLYLVCYRHKGKAACVQALALACLGIWALDKLMPAEGRQWLDALVGLRWFGLALLIALEIKLGIVVYKAVVFSGQTREQAQSRFESEGLPPWLARFMAFEAGLWRRLWVFLQRLVGRGPR
ncbi:hypothetical protein [Inhella proteolytica]|uniref:Transmembrane protein n=1 Tax=Inhella proteolytica TaxID=2795029 RepID=A0A931NDP6_9BURK|nr:hypothetical protein [Inhella proteolytica]MBH9576872.1 hypothetical protein [Inhella proteolytica]